MYGTGSMKQDWSDKAKKKALKLTLGDDLLSAV